MAGILFGCSPLTKIYLTNFDTQNVINMGFIMDAHLYILYDRVNIFNYLYILKNIYIYLYKIQKATKRPF